MATSSTTTAYEHIHLDETGVAFIEGTTMKVVELVMAQKAYGWSPEELHFQHPYLTMSQIHSALAYYREHKEELEADIQRRGEYVRQFREEAGPSAVSSSVSTQLTGSICSGNYTTSSQYRLLSGEM